MGTASETEEAHNDSLSQREMLLQYLAAYDAPCPSCGYNLRHLTQPRCPECGLSLKLSVGSDEPFKRAWAMTLCVFAMLAGIGSIFLLLLIIGGDPGPMGLEAVWFYSPMLTIPLPVLLFIFRRLFCKLPSKAQYSAAVFAGLWLIIVVLTMISDLN